MELWEIVSKLVGPIQPVGHHSVDEARLENLRVLISLVDSYLLQIEDLASCANSPEASVKAIGECAIEYLDEINSSELGRRNEF